MFAEAAYNMFLSPSFQVPFPIDEMDFDSS